MTTAAIRRAGLLLALTAALLAAALVLIGRAGADDGDGLPAPTELRVTAERGSLDVALEWDDVSGADYYRVRWRPAGPDNKLNDGVQVQSSNAVITVARYGEWVARVQACDNAGCGAPAAKKLKVRRPRAVPDITPLPTSTPTPLPTATPTPLPTATPIPEPTATPTTTPTSTSTPLPTSTPAPGTLQVSVTASAATAPVNQPVSLTAAVSNAPQDSTPSYAWELSNGGDWHTYGTGPTLSYLTNRAESWSFRVTVTYGSGISATSGAITVTWVEVPPTPTATPVPLPTSTPIPEPTATPTPEPTATPIPAPTATPTPAPALPIPAKPAGLSVSAVPGSLAVSVDWDDVPGASYYWLRWRESGSGSELNEGVAVLPSEAVITVSGYGEWVARVQACNDSGCGAPAVSKFTVELELTATPTPTRTPEEIARGYRGQLAEVVVELSLRRPGERSSAQPRAPQTIARQNAPRVVAAPQQATPTPTPTPAPSTSIVYVIDDSGSMDADYPEVRTALEEVRDTEMLNTKVALIEFGTFSEILFELTDHSSAPWDTHISSFSGILASTDYSHAMEDAIGMLKGDSADVKKVIFLTDGQDVFRRENIQKMNKHSIAMDVVVFINVHTGSVDHLADLPAWYSTEDAADATGGEYRTVTAPSQGTTVTPAVTPKALSAILPESVADNTATLFVIDTSHSMVVYSKEDFFRISAARDKFKTTLNSALAAAATAAKSATGAQVGLASFRGGEEGFPVRYFVDSSIGSESPKLLYFIVVGGTDIDDALQRAHKTASGATATNKRVVLISDGLSGAAQVQDSTLALYGTDSESGVVLDTVAWGAHDDEVRLKSWADAGDGKFNVALPPVAKAEDD